MEDYLENRLKKNSSIKSMLFLYPDELLFRIYASFVPPLTKTYQKIHVDLIGPIVATILITVLLWFGHSNKLTQLSSSPLEIVASYVILMPILCYALSKLGNSTIKLSESFAIIGYALYGHIVTLTLSFLCFNEDSDFIFFLCLVTFGGFSTLRLALLVMYTISVPVVRLIVCSAVSVVNILYMILFHFGYMHRTYPYSDRDTMITLDD